MREMETQVGRKKGRESVQCQNLGEKLSMSWKAPPKHLVTCLFGGTWWSQTSSVKHTRQWVFFFLFMNIQTSGFWAPSRTINTNSYLPEPRDKLARMDKSAAVCLCPWSTLLVHCPGEPEFQVDGVGGGEAEAQWWVLKTQERALPN